MPTKYLREVETTYKRTRTPARSVKNAQDAVDLFRDLEDATREKFIALSVDSKNAPMAFDCVAIGSVNQAAVAGREAFRVAVMLNAPAVIFLHNHPSGDATPSPEDVSITAMLVKAGKLLDIEVLDHIVIAEDSYISLRDTQPGIWK